MDLLLRVAERRGIPVVRIANRAIPPYGSPLVSAVRVGSDFDAADRYIAEHVTAGDLVITADVPLAAEVVARGALGLSPRGEEFNSENAGAQARHARPDARPARGRRGAGRATLARPRRPAAVHRRARPNSHAPGPSAVTRASEDEWRGGSREDQRDRAAIPRRL